MIFGINLLLEQFLKNGKCLSSLLTGNYRSLSARKHSKNFKDNYLNHKRKHNMSLNSWYKVNTKTIEYFIVDKKQ